MPSVASVVRRLRANGVRSTLEYALIQMLHVVFRGPLHRSRRPDLRAFHEQGAVFDEALALLGSLNLGRQKDIGDVAAEHSAAEAELASRYSDLALPMPREFAVGSETALALYGIVRLLKPKTVVETGVGNGHSTYFLLRALAANNKGVLHSLDARSDAGVLLSGGDKDRWRFHLVDVEYPRQSLVDVLNQVTPIDIFIHDSNHAYEWQAFEYAVAISHLSDYGVLVSDDVDKSFAFIDSMRTHGKRPVFLLDGWKLAGVTPWNT